MIEISDDQALNIIEHKEIPAEIITDSSKVAVVLTQDWCPQWLAMRKWLRSADKEGISVFYLCYNRKPYFNQFMSVKENLWNNHSVPYLRCYKEGKFITETNYIGKKTFFGIFD